MAYNATMAIDDPKRVENFIEYINDLHRRMNIHLLGASDCARLLKEANHDLSQWGHTEQITKVIVQQPGVRVSIELLNDKPMARQPWPPIPRF